LDRYLILSLAAHKLAVNGLKSKHTFENTMGITQRIVRNKINLPIHSVEGNNESKGKKGTPDAGYHCSPKTSKARQIHKQIFIKMTQISSGAEIY
jgi:hypothetical protein